MKERPILFNGDMVRALGGYITCSARYTVRSLGIPQKSPMRNFNLNTANNDEWLTPPAILRALGPFDLDPAAPIVRPWDMAVRHYTKLDDGMAQPWRAASG